MNRILPLMMALLAGCAAFQPGADEVLAVDSILSEVVSVARAPAAEQKAALARAQRAFVADPSPLPRVRLAALLASLPAPLHDDARAAELLEAVADSSSPGTGRLAAFLGTQIAERQRLVREAERVTKEAEHVAKEAERAAKERASLDRERQANDKERDKREEALRQQLEALRAIERVIIDREERLRGKPGAKP
ncbi:MAG TPA: hypothetical protein VG591_02035 [Burkholderiales bacterium]|jgi:hypothetical protein|nr:hypothetical protein [Burkholderiales bacterium]